MRAGFVTCFEPSIRAPTKAVRNYENVLKELKYLSGVHKRTPLSLERHDC